MRAGCLNVMVVRPTASISHHSGVRNDNPAAKVTLWTAYNGVTEYVDHWRDRGDRRHMCAVCLCRGFQIKRWPFDEAVRMVGSHLVN